MPTTAQIAARAGVSTTTVQNVLHGRGSHTPLTRQRVLDVAHQLGHGATRAVDDTWRLDAACRGTGPHLFHPDEDEDGHAVVTAAKRVCAGCPVADPCLEYALDNRIVHGVWGGLSVRQRRAMLAARNRAAKVAS
jgi:WhiB family redox-sensing transcriptional regulator